ncbi:MAG: cysteine--tRNA ligase [Chloroflexi bacterium 13_1_20CM_2_70_9]|nr:MAG: cysteine--tRNA ligase [Chloroflexi bacterium 13_1_20CM_2_70_9]
MQLRIYDTLQRQIVPLSTERPGEVRMYTCGPTVYRPVHLGNLRSYLLADWLRRTLTSFGYEVAAVKNVTDVGHMRQDAVDRGEDKVIAAALAEGKTPQEIARSYERAFREDERRIGILPAAHFPRATEHVPEMIALIERLLAHGLAYPVDGTVYFAVRRFPGYGKLSGNIGEALKRGVRVEVDPQKRNTADFALWKKGEAGRALVWDSPWGPGFPGWHIECSAMSTKYLGERFDLHTGGVDNIFPHHEDEIAQSEGALGHPVVRHWVHGQHLLADGVKMAKSAKNTLTVDEMIELGIDPLAFRYQCLLTHYRTRMHFSLGALRQAAEALDHLRQRVRHWSQLADGELADRRHERWLERFREALADDLNLPKALAWLHQCAADPEISERAKLEVVLEADRILGLDLASVASEHAKAPREVLAGVEEHVAARVAGDYGRADGLRATFDGYRVDDQTEDRAVVSRADRRVAARTRRTISSAKELPDRASRAASHSWSVAIVTREWADDLARCLRSVLAYLPRDGEVIVLDSGSRADAQDRLIELASGDPRVTAILADRDLGEGAARNALLRLARGRFVLQLDPSVELAGDLFAVLATTLADGRVGLAGPWGLRTSDLKHYDEATAGDVDAMQGYCAAARRDVFQQIGFDERYRFYRNLDIATSLAAREKGYRIVATGVDRARRHAHRAWEALSEDERLKRSRKNFDRMWKRFHGRPDLLVGKSA